MNDTNKQKLINDLMMDVTGYDNIEDKDAVAATISDILHDYNLSTDLSFVEKMATMKLNSESQKDIEIDSIPKELRDAAFLPLNTVADIALREDLDMVISQIPEWFIALEILRDAICEADVVTGKLARSLSFDNVKLPEDAANYISTMEMVEEKLDLHSIIKNHCVFDTCKYGEAYLYTIPYAKVFSDLYRYRIKASDNKSNNETLNMFNTSSIMNGYGYGESSLTEVSLSDTIIAESKKDKVLNNTIFTEAEIINVAPSYGSAIYTEAGGVDKTKQRDEKAENKRDKEIEEALKDITDNISYIEKDIAIPVIEQSVHDLKHLYNASYKNSDIKGIQESCKTVDTFFEQVMDETVMNDHPAIEKECSTVKGIYIKVLPATKLIPIRVDRTVIGYYYISDLTRPEEGGQRKNSGLTGYTLRSPSVGYDTFSPDRMFCDRLASKIINNFNLKFMRDNVALHTEIVSILQSHKFNEAMMRFVFIPAEHVVKFAVNKDGLGKGHSLLEPGLVNARMYMFLKLYSLLFQINNSTIRVINLRMSGLDRDYKKFVQETMRKFSARRVTTNDIFNYRSSMTKVSGGSELIMPMGSSDTAPLTIESIPAAEPPINNDLLNDMKNESINATPIPSMMLQPGGVSEIEFAKEAEMANTRLNSCITSTKIDFNYDLTMLYRRVMRWETDINPEYIKHLRFTFQPAKAKELTITAEMISNFDATFELLKNTCLTKDEIGGEENSDYVRAFKKIVMKKQLPQISIEEYEKFADEAREAVNEDRLKAHDNENLLDDEVADEEI